MKKVSEGIVQEITSDDAKENLLMRTYRAFLEGFGRELWKTYGEMNVAIWKRHQNTSLEKAKEMLAESHKKVLEMAAGYSNEELFTKKYYSWTGTTDLGSYFVSTCASHYEWAIKKIKAHCKKVE